MLTNEILERRFSFLGDSNTTEYAYDLIGRVLTKKLSQINPDGSTASSTVYSYSYSYSYSYDGLNLNPADRAGQEGFLTGVSSDTLSKTFIYRTDGKILQSILTIPGFREFKTQFSYLSQGAVGSRIQTVKNLVTNALESNYSLTNEYDRFGNVLHLLHNGNYFAHFLYNEFGQVSNIDLVGKKAIQYTFDDLTRESRDYQESYNGNTIFGQTWNYNNRGLIESDLLKVDTAIGTRQIAKNYAYSPRGFLSAMNRMDTGGPTLATGHSYDSVGLMASESKDGTNITHTMSLDQWNIGGVVYDIDTLGRVIKKDNRVFIYGENGRISKLRGHNVNQADYFYDEENNPILKIYKFGKVEVYLGDNAYVDDNFYEPIKVGTRIVGYFKNGVFVSSSQDHLNTNVVDETGAVNLATAYGERSTPRTEVNEVMDFTLKGFDQDLDAVRMGHRYYDSNAKMFYSADDFFLESPEKILKSPVEGNLYSYAGNEPAGSSDPTGNSGLGFGFGYSLTLLSNNFSGSITGHIVHDSTKSIFDVSSYSAGVHGNAPSSTVSGDKTTDGNKTFLLGFHGDVGGSLKKTNADNISQLTGKVSNSGVTLGKGIDVGIDLTTSIKKADGNFQRNNSGEKINEISGSLSGGYGAEVHKNSESENIKVESLTLNGKER